MLFVIIRPLEGVLTQSDSSSLGLYYIPAVKQLAKHDVTITISKSVETVVVTQTNFRLSIVNINQLHTLGTELRVSLLCGIQHAVLKNKY